MVHEKTTVRSYFYLIFITVFAAIFVIAFFWLPILWFLIIALPLFFVGIYDIFQKDSNILRNYPVWGHWRYILLKIRPQIHAYFIEDEWGGRHLLTLSDSLFMIVQEKPWTLCLLARNWMCMKSVTNGLINRWPLNNRILIPARALK